MAAEPIRRFDVWGAPYDGAATLGWPGSRYAPAKIRQSLAWMLQRRENDQIYCLDDAALHPFPADLITDRGDADTVAHDLDATLVAAGEAVASSAAQGRVPVLLGGDDSLLYPTVRGVAEHCAGEVAVIHFDAHLDMMDENRQQGRWSHSSGMRRALELPNVRPERSIQIGSRHFNFPSSLAAREAIGLANIPAVRVHEGGVPAMVDEVRAQVSGADRVVLAFDIDVIDPAHAPGAGAHEPGGLTSRQALDAVRLLAPLCHGMALTEVNPLTDLNDQTSNLAAYLLVHFAVHGAKP
ncbi:formiminoglutamase [Tamaricihabitans halophyticus]|uniref:Formiminoglutamase n=1 Tax=Tamaricihabitans halophyticus TaxID=1262583 RepID=A0A4V2SSL4_9PSEU|nr:arginase family protein [Tamaricihabitans halophyticus]TCP47236.1 formiminoglutamase [Tamaricihabitans halophyticus]